LREPPKNKQRFGVGEKTDSNKKQRELKLVFYKNMNERTTQKTATIWSGKKN
jgi:hypothetical protein